MRKTMLSLLTVLATIFYCDQLTAQTDTAGTRLDLGRLNLKKEFTQSISIKGEDLEKMPFTSLYEAINAWTYGYYTYYGYYNVPASFVYVVDGNLLNDVNAYSIQDIKEITLVQNALVQLNGANRQQQLIVVTTRKGGADKQGITVSGQSFLTKQEKDQNGLSSESAFFHQYTVAAYKRVDNIQLGASVNYLRNVVPPLKDKSTTTYTPSNTDRFRINAWLNAQLGSKNELYIQLNTAPQQTDADFRNIYPTGANSTYSTHYKYDQKLSSFAPTIGLRSSFLKGFNNHFSAAYLTARTKSHTDQTTIIGAATQPSYNAFLSQSSTTLKTEVVLIRDNISYTASVGNWRIEPAANLTFRYLKNSSTSATVQQIAQSPNNPPSTSSSIASMSQEGRSYFLTPSIGLSYKNIFNLQGGIFSNLSSAQGQGQKIKRIFPFATATFNVLPPDEAHATSVQLFGSYAQTDYFGESNFLQPFPTVFGTVPMLGLGQRADSSYWNWQVGTRIGFWHDRLSINYNFEKRDYTSEFLVPSPNPQYYILDYPPYSSSAHHINVNAAVFNTGHLHWRTGITATNTKTHIVLDHPGYPIITIDDNSYWTGGWVNRLSWKQFSAGVDLLYDFTKDRTSNNDKIRALTIQNIYVGYQLALKGTKGLEIYADSRNLAQHHNTSYKLGGNQQYYGLGFKLNL